MPVLGDQYGRVLEAGELVLERQGGSFTVRYYDHEAPISPRTLGGLLTKAAARAGSEELESLAVAFSRLPHASRTDRAAVVERHRDKEVLRARLADLCRADPEVAEAIDAEVEARERRPRRPRRAAQTAELPAGVLAHRRPRSSPTGGSSTSRPWPGCASRTRPSSPTPTG